ncbi:MAG: DivIVA domain-containing protein [Acidimicrobiales bacterium]
MAVNERRLTGRDVLAKTFQARTKRGYDPNEVDAYLELVAAQVDMLHGDAARAREGLDPMPAPIAPAVDVASHEVADLEQRIMDLTVERDGLIDTNRTLAAENEQLRTQVLAVAPPPPPTARDISEVAELEVLDAPEPTSMQVEKATDNLPVEATDDRAAEESYELVLRMARRSAEETIAEAHARADEIVADANFTAAQISRESDRKAFEAAQKVQADLAEMHEQIGEREAELRHLEGRTSEHRIEMRDLANRILFLADDETRIEGAEVVDLRPGAETPTSDTTA